jgi:predicted metal-dependent phosphoesterase TrpH
MKVELHCHTSRHSACALCSPREIVCELARNGYEAVFLTEHDAVWSPDEIDELQQVFPEIRLFPGLERTVSRLGFAHVLLLGTTDPAYLSIESESHLLAKARDEGVLSVLAHPFRWEGSSHLLDYGWRPDAIELTTPNHRQELPALSQLASREFGLPLVNSGDVHSFRSLNFAWIDTHQPLREASSIRQVVLEGAYDNCLDREWERLLPAERVSG